MLEKTYIVPGMSCEHCVRAIKGELTSIQGVEDVQVDLATKQVTVRARDGVTEEALIKGIEEAGYEVAA